MRPLRSDLLVETWDRGAGQNPLGRALTMLACSAPERSVDEIAELSIPERDLELLRMRRMTFGDPLRGYVACESCGTSLEFETRVSALLDHLETLIPRENATWKTGDFVFSMRPANSRDLAAAAVAPEPDAARRIMLQLCTTGPSDSFGPEFEEAAIRKFEELHRGAEIVFDLLCPACGHKQHSEFDVAQFSWAEVRSAAMTLLRDVDELARAYGWSEAAILGMNDARRGAYLEMIRS